MINEILINGLAVKPLKIIIGTPVVKFFFDGDKKCRLKNLIELIDDQKNI